VARGKPAAGIAVTLEAQQNGQWKELSRGQTDADGRVSNLLSETHKLEAGVYRITFYTGEYQSNGGTPGFYPYVPVIFEVRDGTQHYHVPLLLSPYGFSTYRGS
jgi:5-hydroxyisourate hydrolase